MNLKRIRHGSEMVLSARRGFVRRTLDRFKRKKPTVFHKCLAVHMAGAKPTSALS